MGLDSLLFYLFVGIIALLFAANIKAIPFYWHYKVYRSMYMAKRTRTVRKYALHEPWVSKGRLLFDEADFNMHMNNSSYNKNADVNHYALFARLGMHTLKDVRPALAGTCFHFLKSIQLFARYKIVTQVHSFGKKWIFVSHRFEDLTGKTTYAIGLSKLVVKESSGKTIQPREVFDRLGFDVSGIDCAEYEQEGEAMLTILEGLRQHSTKITSSSISNTDKTVRLSHS
uniref:Thioesterase n=1 Tax=Palpitomonas bilix TaxID=652834 RepID=A0A7S3G2J4_9EUKA|mmetsp:Transcript_2366/g.4906  ORF Transcript_2366/g.4906 Transcript_2366/m.4906 type:complete len:228 (+) Transcript_2366:236-919(+)